MTSTQWKSTRHNEETEKCDQIVNATWWPRCYKDFNATIFVYIHCLTYLYLFKGWDNYNEQTDGKLLQRNRIYINEPNGNSRTEKYIWNKIYQIDLRADKGSGNLKTSIETIQSDE